MIFLASSQVALPCCFVPEAKPRMILARELKAVSHGHVLGHGRLNDRKVLSLPNNKSRRSGDRSWARAP